MKKRTKKGTKSKSKLIHDDYHQHLIRLKAAYPLVDSAPVQLLLSTYVKTAEYRQDLMQSCLISKQNISLLQKITAIKRPVAYRNGYGHINCAFFRSAAYDANNQKSKKISEENRLLAGRIADMRCSLHSCESLKLLWKKNLLIVKKMVHKPIVLSALIEPPSLQLKNIRPQCRPLVYLDLDIRNGRPIGRLIILLYIDFAPITCKKFIDLCENHRDWNLPKDSDYEINKDCQLINTKFHRIFSNLFIYGGILSNDKKIKSTIPDYEPENCIYHHSYKGTLSMCPMENGLINSEFTISLKPLQVLNQKRLAFGRVITGLNILDTVANFGTKNGKPKQIVEIVDCGLLSYNF